MGMGSFFLEPFGTHPAGGGGRGLLITWDSRATSKVFQDRIKVLFFFF